jgi:hypothetical protein
VATLSPHGRHSRVDGRTVDLRPAEQIRSERVRPEQGEPHVVAEEAGSVDAALAVGAPGQGVSMGRHAARKLGPITVIRVD